MNKKVFSRIFIGLTIAIVIATVIAYFVLRSTRPWMAFFVACCGGVIAFNFLITLFLIKKNFKK